MGYARWRARLEPRKGVTDEQRTGSGWYTQRRVRSDIGREARTMGGRRPPLHGLGDLSPQGVARRPDPALRVSVQQLVWTGDPALGRRWQHMGVSRQRVRLRRGPRHSPVV